MYPHAEHCVGVCRVQVINIIGKKRMFKKYISDLRTEFKGYNGARFSKDVFAGITTCAVALPLALAFGVSSGADAAAGLITAIIAGIVIGALSGASYQISGPTGAMAAILVSISAAHGVQGVFFVGLLSGILLLIVGILKLGRLVSLIPAPVITGFTSGIAIIIVLGQLDNILSMQASGSNYAAKIASYFAAGTAPNYWAVGITVCTVLFMVLYPKKLNEKLPGALAVIILAIIINLIFKLPVDIIGTIPATLLLPNRLQLTQVDWSQLSAFIAPAISVACLGLVESLLCGACGGVIKGEKMDANREVIAQAVGNIIIPFFGGVPATAAIARTSVAIKAGSQTRLTSIIHGLGLVASMLLLGSVMSNIPLSVLAGVLLVTAWRMNDWAKIKSLFKLKFKSSIMMFLLTMVGTVVFDLTAAIALGVLAALVVYVYKSSRIIVDYEKVDLTHINIPQTGKKEEWGVVFVTGPLFFLTCDTLKNTLETLDDEVTIFSMRGVTHADDGAAELLHRYAVQQQEKGGKVVFACLQNQVKAMFDRYGLTETVGENAIYFTVDKAINALVAQEISVTG